MPAKSVIAFFGLAFSILIGWQLLLPRVRPDLAPPRNVCGIDANASINDMLASSAGGTRAVPKGYVIEQRPVNWTVSETSHLYALPSRQARILTRLPRGANGTGICRVKAPDGRWWVAEGRDRNGYLMYVPEDEALPKVGR